MADEPVRSCAPIHCPPFEDVTMEVLATSALDQYAARGYAAYARSFEGVLFLGQPMHMLPYEELHENAKVSLRNFVQQLIDDLGVDRDRIGVYRD